MTMTRNRWIAVGVGAALIVGGIIMSKSGSSSDARPTATVSRGTVEQQVTVTGKTKSSERVDLGFQRSGRVVSIPTPVGTKVTTGQLLVQLDAGEINAQMRQASASLKTAQAQRNQYAAALQAQQQKLIELKNGVRPEELVIKQTEIQQAESNLTSSYDTLINTLADAAAKADNAITNTIGTLFSGSVGNYSTTYNTCELQARSDAERLRSSAQRALEDWKTITTNLSTATPDERDATLQKTLIHLNTIQQFLERTKDSVSASCTLNDATLTTARANASTALIAIVTSQSSLKTLQQTISSQKLSVQRLKNELALKEAGVIEQQISAQQAAVKQAEANLAGQEGQIAYATANVQLYAAQAGQYSLRAPFSGVVTLVDIKPGEIVSAGKTVVSLMGVDNMEIEANIPEVDIGKISLGKEASLTIDALQNETFTGTVIYIDPAETIVDGVVNYKIRIAFTKQDERIKSGLTTNIGILTERKENVLRLPSYAITESDAGTFAERILADGKTEKVQITTGMRGSDGMIEILSGISENETVIAVGLN